MSVDLKQYEDSRSLPRYSIQEAAMYLHIKPSTLRSWVIGRAYPTATGPRRSKPVITIGALESGEHALSFLNLAEAHVLSSIRFVEKVKLPKIRAAIDWLKERYPVPHPLITHELFTDGADVFVKKLLGRRIATINASAQGQTAIEGIMNPILNRIKYDKGTVVKIFPSVPDVSSPKLISMAVGVAAGHPVVDRKGVRAFAIWNRFRAGETVEDLAYDYEVEQEAIQAAIDYVNFVVKPAA